MLVKDLMTQQTCTVEPSTRLNEVAKLMAQQRIGAVPVAKGCQPVGIITDRDIVCRGLANDENPLHTVEDNMTSDVVTAPADTKAADRLEKMQQDQIGRMLVGDGQDQLCGVVTQAHIVREGSEREKAKVVKQVGKVSG